MVQCPNNGYSHAIYKTGSLLPSDFFVWVRMNSAIRLAGSPTNGDSNFQIGFFQGISFSDCVIMGIDTDPGTYQVEFAKLQGGVSTTIGLGFDYYTTLMEANPISGFGIQKVGTTYYGWSFADNGSAIYHGSTTWTGSLNNIMIRFSNAGSSGVPNPIVGIDFIRFVTGSTFLP